MKQKHFLVLMGLFIMAAALACPLHQSNRIAPIAYYKMFVVMPALCILYLFWHFRELVGNEREIVWSNLGKTIYAIAALATLSVSWAMFTYDAVIGFIPWVIGAFTFFMFENSIETEDDFKTIVKWIVFTGVSVACIGISQHLLKFGALMQGVAPSSTFGNKNMAAQFVAMTLPLAWVSFFKGKGTKQVFKRAIPLILNGTFILYVQSRGAWLSTIVGSTTFFVVAFWKFNLKSLISKAHLQALALCGFFIFIGVNLTHEGFKWQIKEVTARAESTFAIEEKGSSNQIRYSTWMNSLEMFKDHWFKGVGVGNWRVHYPKYHSKKVIDLAYNDRLFLSSPHNEFLDYVISTGILGLILLGFVAYFLIKIALGFIASGSIIGYAGFCSVVAICSNACFSFPFKTIGSMTVMAVIMGSISKLQYILKDLPHEEKKYFKDTNAKKFLTAFVCILLLAFHGVYYSDILKGYNLFIKGQQIYLYGQHRKDRANFFKRATPFFRAAYKYNPWIVKNLLYWSQSTFNTGLPEIGLDKIQKAIKLMPYDKILLKKHYLYLIKTNRAAEAKEVASRIMKNVPYHFFGFWAYGDILWKEKKYQEAVTYFRTAKKLKPDLKFMPYVQKLMDGKAKVAPAPAPQKK